MNDKITGLEKAALITTGAAAAYKTLLWSLEASVDSTDGSIAVLRIIFAALSFVAFDLVITSVVFRGWSWSGALALLVAAAVSAAIGLDVARVWTMPALHAAPAITLAAFGAHLMWCRRVDLASVELAQARHELAQLGAGLAERDTTIEQARHMAAQLEIIVAQRDTELVETRRELDQVRQTAQLVTEETLTISQRSFSLRQLAGALEIPESTVRRRLTQSGADQE
jgi:hypothetical protein